MDNDFGLSNEEVDYETKLGLMLQGLKMLQELSSEAAKTKKIMFDSYVEEGFTPQQALELCRTF